jgi:BirA family biotin operon repressor/biotin-[acetyl-CoA-carboxylase] ligase
VKTEILKMLRESGGYVSGQQLCEKLGVSRTAVWKVIGQLKEEGYHVEAVRNRGYRIVDSPDILTAEELKSLFHTKWAGQQVVCYKETDSTNIRAKVLGEDGAPHGTLVVADMQKSGKGRRGRAWESKPGISIYMTLLLRPDIPPVKAPMLTLVAACAAAEGLKKCTGLDVQIKWPNDIVVHGKKLAGILTEMSTEIDYINYVVTGIGINVNTEQFSKEIENKATSLFLETGSRVKRALLIAEIIRAYEEYYAKFLETEDLSLLKEVYNERLVNRDREVRILGNDKTYTARALGITATGELIVRRQDGTEEKIYAGEVSVRGVYGYV